MRYTIFGDMHGSDLTGLETALNYLNPDVLICLGDFDQTRTIHQFMDIEKRYLDDGRRVIKVAGNHDHAILTDLDIFSKTLAKQGKTSHELHKELKNDPVARKYIDDLVNTNKTEQIFLDIDKFDEAYKTIIMHGAYDGDCSSFGYCPEQIKHLWARLLTYYDHHLNFKVMDNKGYNIMIRGHDHNPKYASEDSNTVATVYPQLNHYSGDSLEGYRLLKNVKHTINPGALFDGNFATIDTDIPKIEEPVLRYFKL